MRGNPSGGSITVTVAGRAVPSTWTESRPSKMRASLIVAAGGTGSRFAETRRQLKGSSRPQGSKLFLALNGRPVLVRSIESFQKIPEINETIVALPRDAVLPMRAFSRRARWKNTKAVEGGKTRAESVWKALRKTDPGNDWILVHDGARPLIQSALVEKLFHATGNADGVILGKKVVPTLKEVGACGEIRRTVDRRFLFEAETPQLVRRKVLEKAYRLNSDSLQATDEASLLESIGAKVKLVPHESWNPKITTASDWELAEAYCRWKFEVRGSKKGLFLPSSNFQLRTGLGSDLHRLVKGRPLYLGGIAIPFEKGALGHSDGDAVLHAVTDAILGAAGLGDIGEWFSDCNPKFKNIRSEKILQTVLAEIQKHGWKVEHIDAVIFLERPKLGSYKEKMKTRIATILRIASQNVSIKAKTMEGLGPVGEGNAVGCDAVVTLRGRK